MNVTSQRDVVLGGVYIARARIQSVPEELREECEKNPWVKILDEKKVVVSVPDDIGKKTKDTGKKTEDTN